MSSYVEDRKAEHINISLNKDVNARRISTNFENVLFVHKALPETDRDIC